MRFQGVVDTRLYQASLTDTVSRMNPRGLMWCMAWPDISRRATKTLGIRHTGRPPSHRCHLQWESLISTASSVLFVGSGCISMYVCSMPLCGPGRLPLVPWPQAKLVDEKAQLVPVQLGPIVPDQATCIRYSSTAAQHYSGFSHTSTHMATLHVESPSMQAAPSAVQQVLPRSCCCNTVKLTGVVGNAALAREGTGHICSHLCRHCSRCSTTCVWREVQCRWTQL
jgi:hypothetical protein